MYAPFISRWLIACASLCVILPAPLIAGDAMPANGADPPRVEIIIRARQFRPPVVKLPLGKPARLAFRNLDAELHAFVPKMFLDYLPIHIQGNGAAQFGASGLVRIVIPSGGEAEVWYTPPSPGLFTFYCDMPGHQMVGQIIVE